MDREEDRQLWRDTQQKLSELARVMDRAGRMHRTLAQANAAITRLAEESSAADRKLGERIDSLVSAIGEMIRARNGGTQ